MRSRRPGPTTRTRVVELTTGEHRVLRREDRLASEEPLEVRIAAPGLAGQRLGVLMRTPGHDFELAAGWLVHEGVGRPEHVTAVRYCTDVELTELEEFNVVTVELDRAPSTLPAARLVSSACGVCGTDTISEALRLVPAASGLAAELDADVVRRLPEALRQAQRTFSRTGGSHAAGLFTAAGEPVVVREDVGRHNAVDKVVGARVLAREPVPPVLVVSGRIAFELVQKAVASGVQAMVAVGAPTSLAVELAERAGLTLVGFTRPERCVVYAGAHRLGV